ncbi:hypothetical protein [Streptomyces sp. NPDC001985]|uniref:hypothetical protein n=1 Tax=Streptomyces sp. NPDC001985 TaxID=3154406 RepID=UPI00332DD388
MRVAGVVLGCGDPQSRPQTSRSSPVTPGSTTFRSTSRLVARSNSRVGRSEPIHARWYSQRASANHWPGPNFAYP